MVWFLVGQAVSPALSALRRNGSLKWFDYAAPATVREAVDLLAAHPRAKLLAGGTDLLVQLRSGRKDTDLVVDVKRIPELTSVQYDPARGLTLGAAAPCYRIYGDGAVAAAYPALADVASLIGGTQIQGRASIGGNLCNAAPSADSVPLLIAYSATCQIQGPGGSRECAVEDFCTAPGRNVLQPGELLVSIHLPPPQAGSGAHYLRFIPRNEMDIAVAGAGVEVTLEDGHFRSARIALAAVAPTPLYVAAAGEALAGKPVAPESIAAAADLARAAALPITDMRGTAEYRRHLCGVLTQRALEAAIRRARGQK
jgi:carbon-monoxide dehydrogenase medium subunit